MTDAVLGSVLVTVLLLGVMVLAARKFALIPTRVQVTVEMIVEYLQEQLENAFHSKERAQAFLPFFLSLLLFLLFANQVTILPFVFEITFGGVDLFRQSTSDLTQPFAFSLLVAVISHVMAFRISPLTHIQNFIAIKPVIQARSFMEFFTACVGVFVGLLNIVGEVAKVVSLAARLFGNIFAGNVMAAVIMSLSTFTQFLVPLPFLVQGMFSGLVQAFVFMLLSIQFIALSIDGATPQDSEPESSALEPASATT